MDSAQIDKLKSAGIDYEAGIDRFGGNNAMFEKFIRRFTSDTHYQELLEALDEQDCEKAYRCAHSLKGVVGNLSFVTYHDLIAELSDSLHEENIEKAQAQLPQIKQAHEKVIEVLEEIYSDV